MTFTKKVTLVASAAAFVLAYVAGTGSASAAVLCKSAPESHVCPAADVYAPGTELGATVKAGTSPTFKQNGSIVAQCSGGAQQIVTVVPEREHVANITGYSLTGCSWETTFIKFEGAENYGSWQQLNWLSGTHSGTIQQRDEVRMKIAGLTCYYRIVSQELKGGTNPTIVDHNSAVVKTGGSFACPELMTLDAEYAVNTPTPLFVEKE